MSRKNSLQECKTSGDFLRYAERHGCAIERGRHTCIVHNGHRVPVPTHGNGELCKGTRAAIIRALSAIGLAVAVIAMIAAMG
jgi:hypothetical protein